jgi:hypothetical protein
MQKKSANKLYPFKVWLSTIGIVAPLLMIINGVFNSNNQTSAADSALLFVTIIFALFFSMPVLIVHYLVFNLLIKKQLKAFGIKLILCIISIAGIYIIFHLIRGSMEYIMSAIYSLSVILPSFIFKIYQNEPAISKTKG